METYEYDIMAAVEHRHWWYAGMRAITAAWLDAAAQGRYDQRILDAGCGTGANVQFLGRYGATFGLDVETKAVHLAQRRAAGRVLRASVETLPFSDAAFDIVTSFEVLYHRAVVDVPQALAEVRRVLRPNGLFLVRLPAYQWLFSAHDRSVHARERYTAGQVRTLLGDNGFVIRRLSYVNGLLFPVVAAQRLVERLGAGQHAGESALEPPAPGVNGLLRQTLEAEAVLLDRIPALPWGLSVLALAEKR